MSNKYDPVSGDVVPVFLRYAIPSVIGMVAVTSAGIIDGIFIGNFVGAKALAAINISMPLFAVFASVVFMLAVGGSVMCGKFMGASDQDKASLIFSKTLYASVLMAALITLPCLLFQEEAAALLGANEELRPMVMDYMRIIVAAAPLLILGLTLDYFVRIDGRPVLASVGLVALSVINIVLDWLFIVRLDWGIEGAAWATALADIAAFFILVSHWFSTRCNLKLVSFLECHRDGWRAILSAGYNGFSEFANEISIGLITLLLNWVMITRLGVAGVAAFTIIGYLLYIGLEVCYGISEALQPTVSKNLGARKPERIARFGLTAVASSFGVGLIVSSIFLFMPDTMISLFLKDSEGETIAIAKAFLAVFWPAFLFNGMNIALASYFTALHKPLPSAAISLSRSLVLPGLGLLLLPIWFGDQGVYLAIPVAEAFTFLGALVLVSRLRLASIV